jgi:RHS repeat-associated protein
VFKFDALGNLLWSVDALGRRTTCEYAGQNLLTAMTRPDGSTIRWSYDARGRITAVVDGLGRETRYEYSPFGSVVHTIYPDGRDERLVLDQDENLREVINSKGESCRIERDEAFRERQITLFDGRTATQEFDARNQVIARTNARGETIRIEYDGADTPVRLELPDATVRAYTLNESAKITAIRQTPPPGSDGPTRTAAFEFNASNYVIAETHDDYEVRYDHNRANDLTGIRDSLGRDIRYTLGSWGSVVGIQDGPLRYELDYSREGELVELRLPNGMIQRFEFDACSRLVRRDVYRRDGQLAAWRRFVYDAADQLTELEDWRLGIRRFEHDRGGRVTRVLDQAGAMLERYAFDSEGNMVASPNFTGAVIGAGNRLVAAGPSSFEYDAEGHLTRMRDNNGEWSYEYDALGQLVRVTRDGRLVAEYEYDLTGRRTTKITPDERIRYHYYVNVLAEMTSSRGDQWRFLFVPFTFVPLAQYRDGAAYFYSWDQAGVPTELWAEDGTLAAVVTASAFGADRTVERFTPHAPPIPFHFMGQIVDEETSLHYNRFRYYVPMTGRFTRQDPFGLAAGLNLYTYPTNPLNVVDPLGLAGLTLKIKCVPSEPPPFTPCEQAALQTKIGIMNANLSNQGRKARCTSCRDNEQKDYFINTCGGKVPKGWQVDHIQELQVGGGDLCCENLMAIPQRPNGSCGSQIYHQVKNYGGTIVGAIILPPGCKDAHKCKSDGTKRGNPPPGKECEHPNPVC